MKSSTSGDTGAPGDANASFRLHLQAELARRCARNPRYSLRAFAGSLEIDHSTLSQLLRGRRRATEPTIRRLGGRLGLAADVLDRMVAFERRFPSGEPAHLRAVRSLAADAANMIADWYHFAILELLRLESFQPDSRWIARVLGITVDEVNMALHRLIHLGFLEMRSPREWVDCSGDVATSIEDFSHAAVQRLSEQVRELSLEAVRSVPTAYRDHSSTTIAIDTRSLPEALELLARMRRDLVELLESGERRDDVYRLEIGFFPLTRLQKPSEDHEWARP